MNSVLYRSLVRLGHDEIQAAPRDMCSVAVGRALYRSGHGVLATRPKLVVGIVGCSDYGDRYDDQFKQSKGRLRPSQFGSSVLNSIIGECSVTFGLKGPQISVAPSDNVARVAIMQLVNKRADVMITCVYNDEERDVIVTVMELLK